jgi:hypothetical protein
MEDSIKQLHEQSCREGKNSYKDPSTGFLVITEIGHLKRGYCCNNGCRHCPWKKEDEKSHKKITEDCKGDD